LPHDIFRPPAKEQVRRVISGGGALREEENVPGEPASDLQPHIMPEIGRDFAQPFGFLGRAGDIDDDSRRRLVLAPEKEHLDAVILVTFEIGETGLAGLAVHDRRAVEVVGPAVPADDRVAERPTHAAGLTALPGFDRDSGGSLHEEVRVFRRRHYALVLADIIERAEILVGESRPGVSVRGVQKQLLGLEVRQTAFDHLLEPVLNRFANEQQVAGDEDRLLPLTAFALVSMARAVAVKGSRTFWEIRLCN
jgi:hypothetical protein